MLQGGVRGPNLGHLKIFLGGRAFYRIVCLLFRTNYYCVTSKFRVHDPGWDLRSKSRTPLKCYSISSD